MIPAFQFVSIVLAGVAAGTMVTNALAVAPAETRVGPRQALAFHQALEPLIDRYNPACVIGSVLAGIAVLVLGPAGGVVTWTVVGVAGGLAVGVTSMAVNVRINRQMRKLNPEIDEGPYLGLRRTWNRAHAVRTVASLAALSAFAIAALLR